MPAREIPKNYRYLTGLVAPGMDAFEATLERDFYILLGWDDEVASIEPQPVGIPYIDSTGRKRIYHPDVLVKYRPDGLGQVRPNHLYEVKPRERIRAEWPDIKPKYRAGRRWARERGWRFGLITEKEIRTPYLDNVKFLRRYRRHPLDVGSSQRLLGLLEREGETTPDGLLDDATQDVWERARLITEFWALVAQGKVACDLAQPLTMASPIRLLGEGG